MIIIRNFSESENNKKDKKKKELSTEDKARNLAGSTVGAGIGLTAGSLLRIIHKYNKDKATIENLQESEKKLKDLEGWNYRQDQLDKLKKYKREDLIHNSVVGALGTAAAASAAYGGYKLYKKHKAKKEAEEQKKG